ncbi:MAG: purine-nucleoside phosphorylase [Actinomycetaceae bacterium]|nr:purine-nucleoside phosphorylase [Actinomycetaceae bacterium]
MATPHIAAEPGDFAPAVLMPGDPKRAQRIAELILSDIRQVNDVRGMLGFTGTVNGQPLSVMGSGMGQPSFSIYATELFSQYDVQRIIRVGTAGGISHNVSVGDVIIATGAHTDSAMNQLRIPGVNFSAVADFRLASIAWETGQRAKEEGRISGNVHAGTIISRDHFYFTPEGQTEALERYGVLGVEMEAAALYGVAAEYGRQALAVLTVSDHLFDHSKDMTATERETLFQASLELAVAAALSE